MSGKRLTELTPIKQAVATYAGRAAEKLRAQGALVELRYPTNDTLLLTRAATEAVERVFEAGYRYSKAEVLLLDLRQPGEFTDDLFAASQPAASDRLMSMLDQINDRYGRGTVRAGSVPRTPDWGMRRDMMSQSFTTRIDQLWKVSSR